MKWSLLYYIGTILLLLGVLHPAKDLFPLLIYIVLQFAWTWAINHMERLS